jgi:hypothetical protein
VRAPDDLHRRVEALVDQRSSRRRRWRLDRRASARLPSLGWRLGGAIAILAAALALMLGLPGGGSTALSLRQASALTLRPATMAAPSENPSRQGELARSVDGVAFPYWEDSLGWRSTGARVDRIDGRLLTTVFYANGHRQRIGYAILAGSPAPRVGGGTLTWRSGIPYRLVAEDGVQVVAWNRGGHLCVIAGRGVSSARLLRLASSDER